MLEIKEEPVDGDDLLINFTLINNATPNPMPSQNTEQIKIKNEPEENEIECLLVVKNTLKRKYPNSDPVPILTEEEIKIKNENNQVKEKDDVLYVLKKKRSYNESRRSPSPLLSEIQLKKVKFDKENELKKLRIVEKIGNFIFKF